MDRGEETVDWLSGFLGSLAPLVTAVCTDITENLEDYMRQCASLQSGLCPWSFVFLGSVLLNTILNTSSCALGFN